MFAGRSVALGGEGSSQTFGVDGVFSFFDNVRITSYLARTQTPGVSGDDTSYQAQFEYGGDRWGLVLDRLAVGDNFNPEMGFVRRDDFRRNFAELRFSPRPQGLSSVRKFLFQGSVDYTTDGTDRLETRLQQGIAGIEFESGDYLFAGVTDNFELLDRSFEITPDIVIPVGAYHFVNTRVVYAFGQQRMVSGGLSFDYGGFFDGDRTGVGYNVGRVTLSPRLSVEPSVSFNRITGPQGNFSTRLVSARTTYAVTPRMFAAALVQYNSTLDSLGTNLRFRWEYQPGSELFVVYTD
jgi:hypothetical protein